MPVQTHAVCVCITSLFKPVASRIACGNNHDLTGIACGKNRLTGIACGKKICRIACGKNHDLTGITGNMRVGPAPGTKLRTSSYELVPVRGARTSSYEAS